MGRSNKGMIGVKVGRLVPQKESWSLDPAWLSFRCMDSGWTLAYIMLSIPVSMTIACSARNNEFFTSS
jgi:hypothetical protein